jgi:hypothetical protein
MKRLNLVLTTGLLLAMPMVMRATVLGGPHDFSTNSWNAPTGDVCETCHIPHASDTTYHLPLWNHTMSGNSGNYTPYTSPSFVANVGVAAQPDGPSLACLSCHDGTVAINSFFNTPYGLSTNSPQFIKASHNVTWNGGGTDLSHNHPISFTYNSALATKMGDLNDPLNYAIGNVPVYPGTSGTNANIVAPVPATWAGSSLTGKSIDQAMLWNHEMECSSCHDVHGMVGSSPSSGILLKISGTDSKGRASLICRNCHMK